MKMIRCLLVLFVVIWKAQAYAESWGAPQFFYLLAKADTIGIGIDGGSAGAGKSRINNAVFWLGDPGTNHVVLSLRTVGWDIPWDPTNAVGDRVFFWGVRQGWNKDSTNFTFRAMPYSAWELREKLIQAGSAKQTPTPSFEFSGNFIYLTTNSPAMVSFLSNAVHSLCVEPNLIQYSQSLIPPLNVDWENELFMFKADAHMETLKLGWGEDEAFLVHVLDSPQYPRRFRGSALFQLQKRFGWSETNTVPEL